MLDGVLQCRNEFFDIWRHRAATLDVRPQRERWRRDHGFGETNRVEVVVKVGPLAAMPRIAGQADPWSTISPVAHSPDVGATRVGEEYVSTAGARLRVALQASGSRCECGQVGLVLDRDEHIDVLGPRFLGRDRSEQGDRPHAGNVLNSDDEPPQTLKQMLTVIVTPLSSNTVVPCCMFKVMPVGTVRFVVKQTVS